VKFAKPRSPHLGSLLQRSSPAGSQWSRILNLQLRVFETSSLERQVAHLEKLLAANGEHSAVGEFDDSDLAPLLGDRSPEPEEGSGKNGKGQPS
jgi:hypothetical protein